MYKGAIFKFLFADVCFIATTAAATHYRLDTASLNLWLALLFILGYYLPRFKRKVAAACLLLALIIALSAFFLPAKIWGFWQFSVFLGGIWLFNSKTAIPPEKLIIFAGAFFNLCFITNTAFDAVQYDFNSCYNYLEYILENNFLFWKENPLLTRPSYSTYHPILHFFIAAGYLRVFFVFALDKIAAAEAAQVAFVFYMFWYYLICLRLLTLLQTHTKSYFPALFFIVFFPSYHAISGFFNNDCLLLPLQASAIYYALLYYQQGGKKNLGFVLCFATAAALTKLSGILILPMVGTALLLRLWQMKDKQTLTELAVFGGCLIIGISIWPLYQHFWLDIPATFVPPQEHLSVRDYPLWDRLNPLKAIFNDGLFYSETTGYNLWSTLTQTALFGQWNFYHRCRAIVSLLSFLTVLYKCLIVITIAAIGYLCIKKQKLVNVMLSLILIGSLLGGFVLFNSLNPFICNQDFRYIALLPLPIAMIWAMVLDILPRGWRLAGASLLYAFGATSLFIWWWSISFGG